ncbi:ShlB/FhaC/HecB family hemolysin secretion/activation protein [Sphingomonas sp.]|uniref:ShlB/FhaC/HecB family hemolysin secretion/activation protein n=1 Tax=Sphingomonas sp. TaxID=28214 RepID=UPI001B19B96F|nr:ShlB/FhaC/HecB family hemolysin secretion/activation protein [Sphingomonas sp.]MBO9714410.1 ShlB/FhaC/HecB family hemolysin secretion/activation protein [Sphingomonas sp.]
MLILALLLAGQDSSGAVLVDRDRIDRPAQRPTARDQAPKRGTVRVASEGATTPIRGIRFQGAKAPAPVARAAQRFLGRTASKETLAELAGSLSQAYARTDVALYTVAIPEQDFASGTVTVLLTEGRLAKASVKDDRPGRHGLLRKRIAPMLGEAPLSRATFERQVSLMKAIPGLTFETDFADPGADGSLALTVTPKQKRTRFSAGFSNRGIDLLGDGQFDASAEFYGLAVDGDDLKVSASAASDLKRYRYASGTYALPLTASGLTLTASAAWFETRPKGVPLRGTAKLAGVSLGYPVIRSFHRALDVSLGVDGIDSDNAAFGNLIASERTRAVRLGASFTEARDRRTVALGGSLSKGLDVAGARVTAPLAETGFLKANGSAFAEQRIGKPLFARVTLAGQYTRDRLPAAERFAVGGSAIGRAFDTGFLTADRGVGVVGELAVRPARKGPFATSEVYGFADRAWLGILGRGVPGRTDLAIASAGVGARLRFKDKGEIGLEGARAIDVPAYLTADGWRVSVSWRLSI